MATYRTTGSRFLSLHVSTYSEILIVSCGISPTNAEIRARLQRYHNLILMKAYTYSFFLWCFGPTQAMVSSLMNFLEHTKRRTTFSRTSLEKWSARRRDLYPTTHNNQTRRISMLPTGFETTVSTEGCSQNYALGRRPLGSAYESLCVYVFWSSSHGYLVLKYNLFNFTEANKKLISLAKNLLNSEDKILNPRILS